jgi:hypothetical protein
MISEEYKNDLIKAIALRLKTPKVNIDNLKKFKQEVEAMADDIGANEKQAQELLKPIELKEQELEEKEKKKKESYKNHAERIKKWQFKKGEDTSRQRNGGIAKGKNNKDRVLIGDLFNKLLNSKASPHVKEALKRNYSELADEETITIKSALAHAVISKALKGDISAFKEIRDTVGEQPLIKQELGFNNMPLLPVNLTIAPISSKKDGKHKN